MTDLVESLRIEGNLRVNEKEEIFGNRKSREDRIADDLCHQAASRISQQDAELERMRREVEEAREQARFAKASDQAGDEYIETMRGAIAALKVELAEARKAAFIEAAGIASRVANRLVGPVKIGPAAAAAMEIAATLRAKAEDTAR